jgi:hypothetical protein
MSTAWSYSSLKTFQQCPKKYYHLKVAKDVKDAGNTATIYGNAVHKAAEQYVMQGIPVPPQFAYATPVLDVLRSIDGDKHCELKLGLIKEGDSYKPCGFFDKDVWWRGIADLLIIQGDAAFSIDYKTSKNAKYADVKQLDLVATALFTHFPQVQTIKSGLLFLVSNEFITKDHVRDSTKEYMQPFHQDLMRLEQAMENGVWNAVSGPLCGWCPVKTCPNYKERKNALR